MSEKKKYRLTDETITIAGVTLYRIQATRDFDCVCKGDRGGFVQSENNLSQENSCWVCGDAMVCGNAWVCGDAEVKSSRDYIVFKNFWSSGRYFTYTRSNGMWTVGCFHGTGEELIRKAYADSQEKGWQYERVVRYVEDVERHEKEENDKQETNEQKQE